MTTKTGMAVSQIHNTKALYNEIYEVDGHNYGQVDQSLTPGGDQLNLICNYVKSFGVGNRASVLEIGCGLGHLNSCHLNWRGIEFSATAVRLAKKIYGANLSIEEGDARDLPVEDDSIDFIFSFAALEHIPNVDSAFSEIERVLRPGGVAVLSPAWNCRPWTVKKLQQRPYGELTTLEKCQKFLIPIRENLLFRMLCSLPSRIRREVLLSSGRSIELDYRALQPDFALWERYPHISDDDAFVSMDAHAALAYFCSTGWKVISHPTFLKRFSCRGEEIVVGKPLIEKQAR